jgi:hypothetical protein
VTDEHDYQEPKTVKRSSSNENRSRFTVDVLRVVDMTSVRVVEIVPVRLTPAAVVEIVPVLVVEMVPALVVEMSPDFARVGADIATTNIVDHRVNLTVFIVCSWRRETLRNFVGSKVRLLRISTPT